MHPTKLEDPLLLERALTLPSDAIGYHLGRVLRGAAGGAHVEETSDSELDFWALARDGFCTTKVVPGIHGEMDLSWYGRGQLAESMGTACCEITWQGHVFHAVTASWHSGFSRNTRHYVLGAGAGAVRAFLAAALDATHLPADSVLVFGSSCFSRDKAIFRAIQRHDWTDLVLPAEMVDRLRSDLTSFLGSRDVYKRYGVPYKRGMLLTGPPGNGKTLCVRLLAKQAALPTLFVRSFAARYGEEEGNITSVFRRARRIAPCVLVLEDVDSLVKPQCLSVFLNELDGLSDDTGILTIATTNHPERLDPALLERPSRFDRKYHFPLPSSGERASYLRRWDLRLEAEMRLGEPTIQALVERTEAMSFAFLKELVLSSMVRWMADRRDGGMGPVALAELEALRATWRPFDEGDPAPVPTPHADDED